MKKIKRIHVDQHVIRRNRKRERNELDGEHERPITIQTSHGPYKCFEAIIYDDFGNEIAKVIYRPEKPLSCGAKLWIETKSKVIIDSKIII